MSFFFAEEAQTKKNPTIMLKLAKQNGCFICPCNKKNIKSPIIKIAEEDASNIIYILGDFLEEAEDTKNEHFTGKNGQFLKEVLSSVFGADYKKITRFNNIVKCFNPSKDSCKELEIECCRQFVEKDIIKTKPKIVVGLGNYVLKWMVNASSIEMWRGRKIPCKIGEHSFWFFPILHPSFILKHKKNFHKNEYELVFEQDIKEIKKFLENYQIPMVEKNYQNNVITITQNTKTNLDLIQSKLEAFKTLPYVSIDIETSQLSPHNGGKIISIAVGTSDNILSFPIFYKDFWNKEQQEYLLSLLKNFLLKSGTKICHNLKFELEWFITFFGEEIFYKTKWADTMAQAYVLDERSSKQAGSVLSLDSLCKQHFGFYLKEITGVDRTNVENEKLDKVLLYNGMDVKYTFALYEKQKIQLNRTLMRIYNQLIDTAGSLAIMQARGILISKEQLNKHQEQLEKEILTIENEIKQLPEVKKYNKLFGEFKPLSTACVSKILKDILNLQLDKKTEGGELSFDDNDSDEDTLAFSTDKNVLKEYASQGIKLADLLLKYRFNSKLKATYLDGIEKLVDSNYVLRTSFNHLFTQTGRLASCEPNLQNVPKRTGSFIRTIFIPPQGHKLVAFDFGQLEARVIAMASKDEVFCNAIKTGYDVHKEWTLRIKRLYNDYAKEYTYEQLETDKTILKPFRDAVKNKLVFPLFFGSSHYSVARNLGIPENIAEHLTKDFWEIFKGVASWQKTIIRFYEKNNYVEMLTGRRRRAPISRNKIINAPIQGTASDLVINAMNRLAKLAYKTENKTLHPILNIHDDLTFVCKEEQLDTTINIIAKEMCMKSFDFINVPLVVECSVGDNWYEMKHYKDFSTTDFKYDI